MALTRRGDGTGAAYQVNSTWWNDYMDLLTGVMTDQAVNIANTVKAKQFIANGTLGASNQVTDWQQSFGLFSDNVASAFAGATSRLWLNAGGATGTQEMHLGPRAGSSALAGLRILANNVTITNNGTGVVGTFAVSGPTTSLDAGKVTTDGNGTLTVVGLDFATSGLNAVQVPQTGAQGYIKFTTWTGTGALGALCIGGDLSSNTAVSIDTVGAVHLGGSYNQSGYLYTKQSGAANGFTFRTWDGAAQQTAFGIGTGASAAVSVDHTGNLSANGRLQVGTTGAGLIQSQQSGASPTNLYFKTWNGSAGVTPFSLGAQVNSALAWVDNSGNYNGPVSGGIPTTRLVSSTWTAMSVPVYTGATAPTATQAPPTGSIYIQA